MWKQRQGVGTGFAGITIGGSGGGQPLSLVIVTLLVLGMAVATVFDAVRGTDRIDTSKQIPFKCTNCGKVVMYTIAKLQEMRKPGEFGPLGSGGPGLGPGGTGAPAAPGAPADGPPMPMGPNGMDLMMKPITLECPQCHQQTLTQAVQCPKCGEIFITKMDPAHNIFDDKCPKCGTSYAQAWQEKYRKEQGE